MQALVHVWSPKSGVLPQVAENSIPVPLLTFLLCASFHLNALMPLGKSAFLMIYVSKAWTKSHGKRRKKKVELVSPKCISIFFQDEFGPYLVALLMMGLGWVWKVATCQEKVYVLGCFSEYLLCT